MKSPHINPFSVKGTTEASFKFEDPTLKTPQATKT